jgi:dTDP-4-amino-4,6-dideoxygalactose transaminase
VTTLACRELISLPMYPQLTEQQVEYVAANVLEFVAG